MLSLKIFCKIAQKRFRRFIWDKIKNSCLDFGVFEILSTEKILIIFAQIVFSYWLHEYQLIINHVHLISVNCQFWFLLSFITCKNDNKFKLHFLEGIFHVGKCGPDRFWIHHIEYPETAYWYLPGCKVCRQGDVPSQCC